MRHSRLVRVLSAEGAPAPAADLDRAAGPGVIGEPAVEGRAAHAAGAHQLVDAGSFGGRHAQREPQERVRRVPVLIWAARGACAMVWHALAGGLVWARRVAGGTSVGTVRRWLDGRLPYPRLRMQLAKLLGADETELWPELMAARADSVRPAEGFSATAACSLPKT